MSKTEKLGFWSIVLLKFDYRYRHFPVTRIGGEAGGHLCAACILMCGRLCSCACLELCVRLPL